MENKIKKAFINKWKDISYEQYVCAGPESRFSLANQMATHCNIELGYDKEDPIEKEKTTKIAEAWDFIYLNLKINRYKCKYNIYLA